MQGIEQSAINEIGRPDHGWWGNEETTGNPSDRESNELGRHNYKPLIYMEFDVTIIDFDE